MAILIEAISVVINKKRILEQYFEWDAFVSDVPNKTLCADDEIVRVGFMSPVDVEVFVKHLETHGLKYVVDGKATDIAVVDQLHGILVKCDWLEYGIIYLKNTEERVSICSFKGRNNSTLTLYTPENWSYDKSLSKSREFAYSDSIEKRLKFIRNENNLDVYYDHASGKEVYIGRTSTSANNNGLVSQGSAEAFKGNGESSSHRQNVESMLGLTLRLYEKTAQPNPLLPPLRFERADSRCRYLLFCLSTVQLACASKMENPDAVLNECAQAVLRYCLADQPTYFGGAVNPQEAVNQVAPCVQDFLQQWSKYVDIRSDGNPQEVLNIISAMIRDTESSAPAAAADTQRLATVALYVEASIDRIRAQFQ